jgi:acetate kinase
MSRLILVINAGSSSLKFQVFALGGAGLAMEGAGFGMEGAGFGMEGAGFGMQGAGFGMQGAGFGMQGVGLEMRLRGQIEGIGTRPSFTVRDAHGATLADHPLEANQARDQAACLAFLGSWLQQSMQDAQLVGVGHRVVHGGTRYSAPVRINRAVLAELEAFVPLAPLHQPFNLAPIRSLLESRPGLAQVACFDTAFHRTQPMLAELFALPRRFYDEGVRRYGFHGLSYEYIAQQLPSVAPEIAAQRVVAAHLGSGVSMCAMQGGRSVATTMGFTALDGLPMGTRCGELDPGVVIYLARERGMSADQIESLLYTQSGLLGLSGISNDMRELLASDTADARLAVDYFVYRVARSLGALAGAMGGLDALVFTAGIGENSPEIRARVCWRLGWLGMDFDPEANVAGAARITRPGSRVSAWVVPTNEELMIAQHTRDVLGLAV